MGARAMWKGKIALGDDEIPVKIYAAVKQRGTHFRLLHEKDLVPVAQRMVDPATGDEVEGGETEKGGRDAAGRLVRVKEVELEALTPEASRTIEVLAAVPKHVIGEAWYDRPYFLGPDGVDDAYLSLLAALTPTKGSDDDARVCVCRWVMRKKEYLGALHAGDEALRLTTLHHTEEVLEIPALDEEPSRRTAKKKARGRSGGQSDEERELDLAAKLLEALEGPFEPEVYEDHFKERVTELAEKKARGEVITLERVRKRKATANLRDALEASLAAVRKAG